MSPWDVLEIAPTADRNAIRVAYANRLKVIRPDEDAAGFQRLREARDAALWFAHQQESNAAQANTLNDQETVPPTMREPDERRDDAPGREATSTQALPVDGVAPNQADSEAAGRVHERLQRLQSPWTDIWDYGDWWDMLSDLSSTSLQDTKSLRHKIIAAVGDEANLRPLSNDMPEHRWRRDEVLLLLADDFGWRENDQELYDLLGWARANRITTILRNAEQRLEGRHKQLSPTSPNIARKSGDPLARQESSDTGTQEKGTDKIPEISESDLESFFASHDEADKIISYYREAKQKSDWQVYFHAPAMWKSFFWTASYGLWWRSVCLAFYLAVAVTLYVLLNFHFQSVVNWLMPSRGSTGTSISLIVAWIACGVMFLGAVLEPVLYAREWLIQRAALMADKADKLGLTGELERHDFLENAGRQRTLFITIFYIFVCSALAYYFGLFDAVFDFLASAN